MSNITQIGNFTPRICVAARGLLGWSQSRLAEKSKVARKTISDFEAGTRDPYPRTKQDLKSALEQAGIIFLEPSSGEVGVKIASVQA